MCDKLPLDCFLMWLLYNKLMSIQTKVLDNGFMLPSLGLGCWPMGGYRISGTNKETYGQSKEKDEQDIRVIRAALEMGVTHFDTAESYGDGNSEKLLGIAIKTSSREDLTISTKFCGNLDSKEDIYKACTDSLKKLDVDYIDLYYVHWRDDVDLRIQMEAMSDLVDKGLIKHIGVSNFNTASLKKAQSYCKYPIVANQVHYNLIVREVEEDGLLKFCQENDIFLVAYRPVELGKLANSGKQIKIAKKYNYIPVQMALSWLISQSNVVTVFGATDEKNINENIKAKNDMLVEDIEHLRANYGGQIQVSDCVELG